MKNKYSKIIIISLMALLLILLFIYVGFLKRNPLFRLNLNKINNIKSEAALSIVGPDSVTVGKEFTISVHVDSKGNYINAVKSYLEFDPDVLQVINENTRSSFCNFYVEKKYDNTKGEIQLSCGSPYPGFKGENAVQEIEFLSKAAHDTEIKISDKSLVLANDGKGTNLLNNFLTKQIKIEQSF